MNTYPTPISTYRTTELDLAAFLKARGRRLINANTLGTVVTFRFEPEAAVDAEAYLAGAEVPARDLFAAHRSLRALIQQVKEHEQQKNGDDRKCKSRLVS